MADDKIQALIGDSFKGRILARLDLMEQRSEAL
jgi:hypothetical protein